MTATLLQSTKASLSKGVTLLIFTQMWESFSFFGMRALLVLYLVSELTYSCNDAFILYTLYIAFVKIFAVVGGYAVDRFLGYKKAVLIGGALIMAGHLLLTFSFHPHLFFLSLGSIVCGSALFRVSIQALLGLFYSEDDSRRNKGFTLFYVGMNLGGLLAAVLCGFMAKIYGWHVGFGLAALGMAISLTVFLSKIKSLYKIEKEKKKPCRLILPISILSVLGVGLLLASFQSVHSIAIPLGLVSLVYVMRSLAKKMNKTSFLSLSLAFTLLIAFFTAEELWGSLLMVFSETGINRIVFGFEIPSSTLAATNPLVIILLGPLMAKKEIKFGSKLALAFLSLSLAFFTLHVASTSEQACILYLLFGLSLIAVGEVLLAPTILAFASKSAPKESLGMMMGATTLAFSIGSLLSGEVAKVASDSKEIFFLIGLSALGIVVFLLAKEWLQKSRKKLIKIL